MTRPVTRIGLVVSVGLRGVHEAPRTGVRGGSITQMNPGRRISKLPDVGTTIFTVMSRRAAEQGAVNVGQGFPDYPIDSRLASCVAEAIAAGHNQYAPMEGNAALRATIARGIAASGGRVVDPETELTVTCGGTEAIYSAIQAVVGPGDEAIVFDPAYDAYDPAIRLAGGRCVHIPLVAPHFRYDWERVRSCVNERTRLIVINNPHNQTLHAGIQWGAFGIVLLLAMWMAHLRIFAAAGLAALIGLFIVVQNILGSLFDSHLADFVEGWIYVIGVGVAAGTARRGP